MSVSFVTSLLGAGFAEREKAFFNNESPRKRALRTIITSPPQSRVLPHGVAGGDANIIPAQTPRSRALPNNCPLTA